MTGASGVPLAKPVNLGGRHLDVLKNPLPDKSKLTALRIGIHSSTSGGCHTAAERAYRLGCNTLQIFSSSPRQWKPYTLTAQHCSEMANLREQYDLSPLVIHASYLVNLASSTPQFLEQSIVAFRAEVERALALRADYLVLHPGSFRGGSREEGLARVEQGIRKALAGLELGAKGLTLLIENSAGSEFSLGGTFEQVGELVERLKNVLPIAACMDTCHIHVAGHDLVTVKGMARTLQEIDAKIGLDQIPVWHCNDAKAACGSKLDRHQHIGQGTIGLATFSRLLNNPRLSHAAFIAETPIDQPGDDFRNIEALKSVVLEKADALIVK